MGLDSSVLRIIDANLNRVAEGLRVIEDVARLGLNDSRLSAELKAIRHNLVETAPDFHRDLLWTRDASGDVGRDTRIAGQSSSRDLEGVVVANSRRSQESLRVLEELAKTPGVANKLDSEKCKQARFRVYAIEQQLLALLLRTNQTSRIRGLYVIVDGEWLKGRLHADVTRKAILGGARVIQLREKTMGKKRLLSLARDLKQICSEADVLFVVNDYLDVALDCEADGLHVGQDDLPVDVARRLLKPNQILGCSASTIEEARAAQAAGADHIGVGSIYATSTKDARVVGPAMIADIRQAVSVPLVAIGGINKSNLSTVLDAGADAAAVITAVSAAPDPAAAARELVKIIEERA